MRRISLVLAVCSALLIVGAAAAFADTAATVQPAPGWMMARMEQSSFSGISSDAQKLVGLTTDQLKTEMGATSVMSPDGKGGTYWFYEVDPLSANSGKNAEEWIDVDSSGKVTAAIVN